MTKLRFYTSIMTRVVGVFALVACMVSFVPSFAQESTGPNTSSSASSESQSVSSSISSSMQVSSVASSIASSVAPSSMVSSVASSTSLPSYYIPYNGLYPAHPVLQDPNWTIVGKGDFNNDSYEDILWRSNTGTVVAWLLNGSGAFKSGGDLTSYTSTDAMSFGTIDPSYSIAATGDMNGDGFDDIVWRNTQADISAVWYLASNTSTGISFKSGTTNPAYAQASTDYAFYHAQQGQNPGSQWSIVAAQDINNDGYGDLMWRNTLTGQIAVWEMAGQLYTVKAYYTPYTSDMTWKVVNSAYVSGDVFAIVWVNTVTNTKAAWFVKQYNPQTMTQYVAPFASGVSDPVYAVPNTDYIIYFSVPPVQ